MKRTRLVPSLVLALAGAAARAAGPAPHADLHVEATVIAYDRFAEVLTLTDESEQRFPLVLRVDRVITGATAAKYVLANYEYVNGPKEGWPQELRVGPVHLVVELSRRPECDTRLEDLLTTSATKAGAAENRVDRLTFLSKEAITSTDGVVPCYQFDSQAYRVVRR